MIWPFGSNDNDNEEETSSNLDNPSQPEFWESIGIKPIVVDTSDPEYIEKSTNEVCEAIKLVAEELKKEGS